jgi:hypothetical protein
MAREDREPTEELRLLDEAIVFCGMRDGLAIEVRGILDIAVDGLDEDGGISASVLIRATPLEGRVPMDRLGAALDFSILSLVVVALCFGFVRRRLRAQAANTI